MTYLPFFWLIGSLLLVTYRPGFLLGCAMLAFQYDNLYNTTIIGPSLFVLFSCAMLFIAFIQRRLFVLNIHDYLIISFGALYLFAALYSPDIDAGFRKAAGLLVLCIGYYFIARFLASSPVYRERFIFDFGISVLILALIFGYLSVAQQVSSSRLLLGEGSAVGFSQMIDIAAGFSLFYLISVSGENAWIKRIAMLVLFAGIIALLLFNATRGTVVSLVFAVCVYIAVSIVRWRPGSRYVTRILPPALLMFGAFAVLVQFSVQSESLVFGLERLGMNFSAAGFQVDSSSAARMELFGLAWDMFAEAPLLGHGIGSFQYQTSLGYPHNVFLELLAETGLIGTSVFTVLFVKTGWMAGRLFKENLPAATIMAGLFFIMAAHQQISFSLWMAKAMFFSMGVIVSFYVQLEKSRPSSSLLNRPDYSSKDLLPYEQIK